MKSSTFLVRFMDVGAPRPVPNDAIAKAVKRKKVLASKSIDADSTSDYGGNIYAGARRVGHYLIMPGSEK